MQQITFGLYSSGVKAAVLYGREDVRVEEVHARPLQPGEVRVAIGAALTCGTDLKVFKRGYHAKMIVPPAVFGHEFAGTISEVSPAAKDEWAVGDRVVAANSAPCGTCFYCRAGRENLCDDLLFLNGAYAESIVIPARLVQKNLLRLKATTDFRDAALTEPLACVVQGIDDCQLRPGQSVLVIGAGPIGLMFTALIRNAGCEVTVIGRGPERLARARHLGAAKTMDAGGGGDWVEMMNGAGFDLVIEAVGKPQTWEAAIQLARKGGTVNFFGGCPKGTRVPFDADRIHYSSLMLRASFHHTPRQVRRALEWIEAGIIRATDFVDGECALQRLPELFQSMNRGNRAVKTLIRVSPEGATP